MIAEALEFKAIQTGQMPLSDSGNEGMQAVADEIEAALNQLIEQCEGLDVSVDVEWLNFREKLNNPDGKYGSFSIRLIRKRHPQCN